MSAATQLYMHQQPTGLSYAGATDFNTTTFPQYQPDPLQSMESAYSHLSTVATTDIKYANKSDSSSRSRENGDASSGSRQLYTSSHPMIQQLENQEIPAPKVRSSRAIKIVNPNTMKEVSMRDLKSASSVSSARSTPKPEPENIQKIQNFHIISCEDDAAAQVTPLKSTNVSVPEEGNKMSTEEKKDNNGMLFQVIV